MSGSSFTSNSRTSQDVGHSLRSTPSPESKTQELATKPKRILDDLPVVLDSPSVFTQTPENIFRWSWGASAEATPRAVEAKSDPPSQDIEATPRAVTTESESTSPLLITSTSDPGFASVHTSSDIHPSRSYKPSFSGLPSVQSFPPLRTRSSTAEWQKAPLVDLNGPLAGRVIGSQVQDSAYSAGLGMGVGSSIVGSKERRPSYFYYTASGRIFSLRPDTNARLGSIRSVGSGIGTSSRKRITSRRKT